MFRQMSVKCRVAAPSKNLFIRNFCIPRETKSNPETRMINYNRTTIAQPRTNVILCNTNSNRLRFQFIRTSKFVFTIIYHLTKRRKGSGKGNYEEELREYRPYRRPRGEITITFLLGFAAASLILAVVTWVTGRIIVYYFLIFFNFF
jgi:hypothetical protein